MQFFIPANFLLNQNLGIHLHPHKYISNCISPKTYKSENNTLKEYLLDTELK